MKTINKLVCKNDAYMTGNAEVSMDEIEAMSTRNELMVLGRCLETNVLFWERAPDIEFIKDFDVDVLYQVTDPKKRIPKIFPSLPANNTLPVSFVESLSSMSDGELEELDLFKEKLTNSTEIYYQLFDKVGACLQSGIYRQHIMKHLKDWADSVGGSYVIELIH